MNVLRPNRDIPTLRMRRSGQPLGGIVCTLDALFAYPAPVPPTERARLPFHLIVLYTRGFGFHEVDFERYECSPGTLITVAPGEVHRFSGEPGLEAFVAVLYPSMLSRSMSPQPPDLSMFSPYRPCPRIDVNEGDLPALHALFEAIEPAWENARTEMDQEIVRCYVRLIVLILERQFAKGSPGLESNGAGRMLEFRRLVEANHRSCREVAEYAGMMGISTRTLNRLVRSEEGVTAKAYVDHRVAVEAKRLLLDGTLSVKEVAFALGFSNQSYFAKFCLRVTGHSPGELHGTGVTRAETDQREIR